MLNITILRKVREWSDINITELPGGREAFLKPDQQERVQILCGSQDLAKDLLASVRFPECEADSTPAGELCDRAVITSPFNWEITKARLVEGSWEVVEPEKKWSPDYSSFRESLDA